MWDFFGPSPQNMGAGDNTLSNYLNFNLLISLGTEVGPYLPVIYPEMMQYFSTIFNKLYERGRQRLAEDLGVSINLIPNISIPINKLP